MEHPKKVNSFDASLSCGPGSSFPPHSHNPASPKNITTFIKIHIIPSIPLPLIPSREGRGKDVVQRSQQ